MTNLKSDGRISPFCPDRTDVGKTFIMLHEAVSLFDDLWLQSPHWTESPTKEMLEIERGYEEKMEMANIEINRLAREIYKSLTGKEVR